MSACRGTAEHGAEAAIERQTKLGKLMRRAPTIRQWLAMLLAALLLPAAAAVAALLVHSYQRERAGVEISTLAVSRALMQAIDRELASAEGALQALATSPSLDQPDLSVFYRQAVQVLHDRPGNVLVLSDAGLRQLVNTHLPFGAPLPRHGNPVQLQAVFSSSNPGVSNLYLAPVLGREVTSVDVPVLRQGRVRYVLSMQYLGGRLGEILDQQKIPAANVASIYDGAARLVWSSRARAGEVGARAGSTLAAGLSLGPEGIVDEVGPGGRRYVTVFNRSSMSDWTLAIAVERRALNASLWGSLAWVATGALALFGLGLALVRAIGARIARPIRALVGPAIALGTGAPVVLPPLHLREAKEVGHALAAGAALLRERTSQRDQAEQAEHSVREAKRAIERSEAFLRGIFEQTPDGVLLIGAGGRVTRANVQAEQLFGYGRDQLTGLALDRLLRDSGPNAAPLHQRLCAAPRGAGLGGGAAAPLQGQRRDGSVFAADTMASPLRERRLTILTVRDVSASWENEEALRRALEDKSILLKELFHRVKNNLQLIISLFNLQVRGCPDDGARQALVEATNRVRAMALVHERLYESRTLSSIALDTYVTQLCEQLAGAASAPRRGIMLLVEADPVECGLDVAVPLGLVLNELVCNSLKHGYPEGRGGRLLVRLEREPGDMLRLSVHDDGIGLPPGLDRASTGTLGLRLVAILSEQLRATFSLEDRGGACATLIFPLPKHAAVLPVGTERSGTTPARSAS